MKAFNLFLVFVLIITGCESFCDSYLENDSGYDIILTAKLDTNITRHYGVSNVEFLKSFANDSTSILLGMDTSNFWGVYKLKNKAVIQLDGGLGNHPTSKFSYMKIETKFKTLTYYSGREIEKAFKQEDKIRDTLIIK